MPSDGGFLSFVGVGRAWRASPRKSRVDPVVAGRDPVLRGRPAWSVGFPPAQRSSCYVGQGQDGGMHALPVAVVANYHRLQWPKTEMCFLTVLAARCLTSGSLG